MYCFESTISKSGTVDRCRSESSVYSVSQDSSYKHTESETASRCDYVAASVLIPSWSWWVLSAIFALFLSLIFQWAAIFTIGALFATFLATKQRYRWLYILYKTLPRDVMWVPKGLSVYWLLVFENTSLKTKTLYSQVLVNAEVLIKVHTFL